MKLGHTLAHEIAHHLGLFHTSERDGTVLEPLGDTGECRIEQDANRDGTLQASECTGNGADNLMFWDGSGSKLSSEQVQVMQRALILRR